MYPGVDGEIINSFGILGSLLYLTFIFIPILRADTIADARESTHTLNMDGYEYPPFACFVGLRRQIELSRPRL